MSTINETVTAAQIHALRAKSATAGDLRMETICVLALGGPAAIEGADPGTDQDLLLGEGRTQEWARAECARVIADAAEHSSLRDLEKFGGPKATYLGRRIWCVGISFYVEHPSSFGGTFRCDSMAAAKRWCRAQRGQS